MEVSNSYEYIRSMEDLYRSWRTLRFNLKAARARATILVNPRPKCTHLKSSSAVIGSGTRPAKYRHFPGKERK